MSWSIPPSWKSYHLSLDQVSRALAETNQFTSAGMHEENRQLYLAVVDSRLRNPRDRAGRGGLVGQVARSRARHRHRAARLCPAVQHRHRRRPEAVLMNVYSQADGNTVAIADTLQEELKQIRRELPPT